MSQPTTRYLDQTSDAESVRSRVRVGIASSFEIGVGPGNACELWGSTVPGDGRPVGTPWADVVVELYGLNTGGRSLLAVQSGPRLATLSSSCLLRWAGGTFAGFLVKVRNGSGVDLGVASFWARTSRTLASGKSGAEACDYEQCDPVLTGASRVTVTEVATQAAPVELVAGNPLRRRLVVSWAAPAASGAYVELAGVNGGLGLPLLDGERFETETKARLWLGTGTAPIGTTVRVWEEDL